MASKTPEQKAYRTLYKRRNERARYNFRRFKETGDPKYKRGYNEATRELSPHDLPEYEELVDKYRRGK